MPPGEYRIVTDEELIEELSFPVYRRVATMIFVPAVSHHASSVEMVAIDPQELQAAQERDLHHDAWFSDQNRFYDAMRRAVRFWGHDSGMEASFLPRGMVSILRAVSGIFRNLAAAGGAK